MERNCLSLPFQLLIYGSYIICSHGTKGDGGDSSDAFASLSAQCRSNKLSFICQYSLYWAITQDNVGEIQVFDEEFRANICFIESLVSISPSPINLNLLKFHHNKQLSWSTDFAFRI